MRNIRSAWFVAVIGVAALVGPTAVADYKAMVIDVTAGDIYQIEGTNKKKQMVVLYGVVAPAKPAAARLAREAGIEKALGKQVTVRVVQQRPGMTLVELTLPDGTNLSHTLLRAGLLQWDSLTAAGDQGLKDLEALARQDRRGVWAEGLGDPASAAGAATPVMKDERRFERKLSADYDILEGRAYTDEKGVPNLVLRGNGQKIVGFENAAEQQRLEELQAEAEAAEWAAMEAAMAQAEADEAAAEQQRQIDEANAQAQMQNLQFMNDFLLFGAAGYRRGGITTVPLSPY